ncbi:MAG: T9SS type A sorting domain-containing protein [Gemmatimonadales bacterium]|nr:T9SS type A sorting domain-containing protein [Gemmatimonadales bacterium]
MRLATPAALLAALLIAAAPVRAAAPPAEAIDEITLASEFDVAARLSASKLLARGLVPPGRRVATANQQAWDARWYGLDLVVEPGPKLVTGHVTARATVLAGPLAEAELDFAPQMTVDSVKVAGTPAPFDHTSEILRVTLDRPYAAGETFEIEVWYHGTPPGGIFGSVFAFTSYASQPMVWTLSEPFGARTWWPCKDDPADKADSVSVRVSVPTGMKTAGNGVLVEQSDDGTRAVTRWVERYPITTYLVSLASYAYAVTTDWYRPSPVDSLPLLLEGIVAHELAHQWWGDWVTCRDFHHIWLNEGFATFSEALWLEARNGFAAYQNDLRNNQFFGAGTIYVPDVSAFFAALQEYGRRFAYSTAVTEDFQAVCEEFAGRDLGKFFGQWIYGERYPQYRFHHSTRPVEGGVEVSVTLQQIQSWQKFWMPVDVTIYKPSGAETFTVWDSLDVQEFHFVVDQAPDSVAIDKDRWILRTVTRGTVDAPVAAAPAPLELAPPAPNPTRGGAVLRFTLAREAAVRLAVYDVAGARVASSDRGTLAAGSHAWAWDGAGRDGRRAAAGVYHVVLESDGERRTQRLVLLP